VVVFGMGYSHGPSPLKNDCLSRTSVVSKVVIEPRKDLAIPGFFHRW